MVHLIVAHYILEVSTVTGQDHITGKPMIAAPGGFDQVAKEALSRLGVQWEPSSTEKAYQAGSTHIPARAVVSVKARLIGAFPTGNIF